MFECEKCKKKFPSKTSLNQHHKRKTPCEKPNGFSCNRCLKVFPAKSKLEKHTLRKKPCVIIGEKQEIMYPERELEVYKEKKKIDMEYRMLEHKLELQLIQAKKEAYKEINFYNKK
jgi:hypothetical protein